MPGDPKECLEHAAECQRLADMAKSEHARDVFLDLAKTWIKLARDLRHSQDILGTRGGDGPEPRQAKRCQTPSCRTSLKALGSSRIGS